MQNPHRHRHLASGPVLSTLVPSAVAGEATADSTSWATGGLDPRGGVPEPFVHRAARSRVAADQSATGIVNRYRDRGWRNAAMHP